MFLQMIPTLSLSVAAVLIVAMICGAGLVAWRGWLRLKRLELQSARQIADEPEDAPDDTGTRIELAAMKERLRRLEAIASGVEL